ncbi:MAG: hypothetical protein AABX01_02185 [Candidatus Micrarchaeota archaeon]
MEAVAILMGIVVAYLFAFTTIKRDGLIEILVLLGAGIWLVGA